MKLLSPYDVLPVNCSDHSVEPTSIEQRRNPEDKSAQCGVDHPRTEDALGSDKDRG